MRRFFRVAFNKLTVLSLVLAVVVAVLWVRSYWAPEMYRIGLSRQDGANVNFVRVKIRIGLGGLQLWLGTGSAYALNLTMTGDLRRFEMPVEYPYDIYLKPPAPSFAGFQLFWPPAEFGESYAGIVAPIPAVFAMLLITPLIAWRRHRHQRLVDQWGRCPSCGYDLRATPDRCPECGAAASTVIVASASPADRISCRDKASG